VSIKKRISLSEDSDFYLKTDVILSTDIFEKFGDTKTLWHAQYKGQ